MAKTKPRAVPFKAKHGEKTIELTVRFWTNNIAPKGAILPKHCLSGGTMKLAPNDAHGIPKNQRWGIFHSMPDMLAKVERLLIQQSVTVHPSKLERRYRD